MTRRPGIQRRIRRVAAAKSYRYTVVIHPNGRGKKGYWVEVPALSGCFTQGDSIEECMESAREAIAGFLESLAKLGQPIPEEPERDNAVISTVSVRLKVPA